MIHVVHDSDAFSGAGGSSVVGTALLRLEENPPTTFRDIGSIRVLGPDELPSELDV